MANATLNTVITKTHTVTLTLTPEEAAVIFILTGNCVGSDAGPRGQSNSVFDAFEKMGFKYPLKYSLDAGHINLDRAGRMVDDILKGLPVGT